MTNFSQYHRDSLRWFGASGLVIDPDRIITGTSATAAYTRSAYPGRPLFVLLPRRTPGGSSMDSTC